MCSFQWRPGYGRSGRTVSGAGGDCQAVCRSDGAWRRTDRDELLGTPDGRPGWNEWFLRQGYAVYIVDQPARGRSAYYPAVQGSTAASLAHGTEQRITAPEKYNLWPQAKLHARWPGSGNQGDPIFDQSLPRRKRRSPTTRDGRGRPG